jgi:hypothetical protein
VLSVPAAPSYVAAGQLVQREPMPHRFPFSREAVAALYDARNSSEWRPEWRLESRLGRGAVQSTNIFTLRRERVGYVTYRPITLQG